ncbi:MAG: hypothetical protein ACI84K_001115 [Pseudohongiellaceae bacterium]|jgi:hypothetical protein
MFSAEGLHRTKGWGELSEPQQSFTEGTFFGFTSLHVSQSV